MANHNITTVTVCSHRSDSTSSWCPDCGGTGYKPMHHRGVIQVNYGVYSQHVACVGVTVAELFDELQSAWSMPTEHFTQVIGRYNPDDLAPLVEADYVIGTGDYVKFSRRMPGQHHDPDNPDTYIGLCDSDLDDYEGRYEAVHEVDLIGVYVDNDVKTLVAEIRRLKVRVNELEENRQDSAWEDEDRS